MVDREFQSRSGQIKDCKISMCCYLDKENNVFTNNSKTNSIQESWEEFKLIRKTAISKLDESHQNYISQLLDLFFLD
jgi:hypothetical protein